METLSPYWSSTVYPKKYAHGFVVLCFVVVMQSFIINSHEVFIHIHQGCFAGTGAIARLPQCQWSKPDGYGKISQCKTTTKNSKAKTVCIFLGIYCMRGIRRIDGFNRWGTLMFYTHRRGIEQTIDLSVIWNVMTVTRETTATSPIKNYYWHAKFVDTMFWKYSKYKRTWNIFSINWGMNI